MPTAGEHLTVAQGDTIERLASRFGLLPETIAQHPENAMLIDDARTITILHPGDVIFIPAKRMREETRATEARHRFIRKMPTRRLHVRFLMDDKPRANLTYSITVDGGPPVDDTTDGEGYIDQPIPRFAEQAVVHFADDPADVSYTLLIGHLNPLSSDSGVVQRLRNLGYYWGDIPDDWTEDAAGALRQFQTDKGLPVTGVPDDQTRAALKSAHVA